ncbi:MAG: bifunctional nuclease family protein [Bacteroidota bacterium]
MEEVELNIVALTTSQSQPGNFALILEDINKNKRIPIIIGRNEAQAIAVVLEKMQPVRPQTHDLLFETIKALNGKLEKVVITEMIDQKYHASLFINSNGTLVEIDARTSDAVAMSVRSECPIYCAQSLIASVGFDVDDKVITPDKRGSFINYPMEELEELLAKVVQKEDYESAGRIRDAIAKKKMRGE